MNDLSISMKIQQSFRNSLHDGHLHLRLDWSNVIIKSALIAELCYDYEVFFLLIVEELSRP